MSELDERFWEPPPTRWEIFTAWVSYALWKIQGVY